MAAHLPWVICLNKRIVAQGTPDDVFTPEILGRTYGAEMVVVRQGDLILVSDRLAATRTAEFDDRASTSERRRVGFLLEPFRYEFFTRGLLAATLVGGAVRPGRRLHRAAADELHRPRPLARRLRRRRRQRT